MNEQHGGKNRRILIVDDNRAIHDDFRKILSEDSSASSALDETEAVLFGESTPAASSESFETESAYQGEEVIEIARAALRNGSPFAMAFVDVRMPPGLDGIETIKRIWQHDPALQVVICTAYSDYSWDDIVRTLGRTDRLLILEKPFDSVEVRQLASALTEKWNLLQQVHRNVNDHEEAVQERTAELVDTRLNIFWYLGKAAEFRDEDTGNHVIRVGCYSRVLAILNRGAGRHFAPDVYTALERSLEELRSIQEDVSDKACVATCTGDVP